MPELVQVRIKGLVITQQYGALSNGDILRTTPEFAKHLVEDCHGAEYIQAGEAAPEKPKRGRKPKAEPAAAQPEQPAAQPAPTEAAETALDQTPPETDPASE